MVTNQEKRQVVCIGLGGIAEGYLPHLFHVWKTGAVPIKRILLVDGREFQEKNRTRQDFQELACKALDRFRVCAERYPDAPVTHRDVYVDSSNVAEIVTSGSIVFLSPDNHKTRKLVSDHAETLDEVLLISGGNDAIDVVKGTLGVEGAVIVHWRTSGVNRTPPITRHHPEIALPEDYLPTEQSCAELAQSHPQLLATNLCVGAWMVQALLRYTIWPPNEAVNVVEWGLNVKEGSLVPYSIEERRPD